jgi:urease beta subunit
MSEGQAIFNDGSWYISVGGAHFHFTQRNRIVVADDAAGVQLEYGN